MKFTFQHFQVLFVAFYFKVREFLFGIPNTSLKRSIWGVARAKSQG